MNARLGLLAALAISVLACQSNRALADGSDAPLRLKLDPRLGEANAKVTESRPVFGTGDRLYGRTDRESTLEGDAELRRAGTVVRGERITYYPSDDEVVAVGDVRMVRQGNVFTGPQLLLKIDANEGYFDSPNYYLPLYKGRGKAERIDFLGPEQMAFRNATYTTCAADEPDWYVRTDTMNIDESKQEGTGRSANLVFKGTRILYTPWFSFPLGDERRSGFLAPTFSLVSKTGAEILLPYYWNIAPNRDFTLYPRLMARRGIQFGGWYRYLEPGSFGEAKFEYTPNDAAAGTSRYLWSALNTTTNFKGWSGGWNLKGVSDDNYFIDFSRSLLASAELSLPRDAWATRGFGDWVVSVHATRYQNILDARAAPPYERLPQVTGTYTKLDLAGFEFVSVLDATSFSRPLIVSPEGVRLVANPTLAYPVITPGWFIKPKIGLHLSSYQLSRNDPGLPTSIDRSVPTFSIDGGLFFERSTTFFGRDVTQTLEPRLFYVRTPFRDQTSIPVFDTAVADFNFAQLFSENTFIGNDRIADLNQLTTALVSRVINPDSGAESLRMAVGQRLYFSDQIVTIPGVPNRTDKRSDLLLAASGAIRPGMTFDGGLQYSLADGSLPRVDLAWRYLAPDGRIMNAGIRYLRDELAQVDTSWRLPIARRWTSLGRINYSFLKQIIDATTGLLVDAKPGVVEGLLGVEYREDCWTARVVLQRFVTAAFTSTTALFLQLELTGLGRLGSNPFDILRRNIPGYQLPNDRPQLPSQFFGYE
jgi:LPS-assembly protein